MKKTMNSHTGLTLVEILAALAILGIVLISFMTFFTQSAKFTAHNKETLSAVQVAEDVIADVRLGHYGENTSFVRNGYQVKISVSDGPYNLKRAVVNVKSPPGAGISEPEFETQMFFGGNGNE